MRPAVSRHPIRLSSILAMLLLPACLLTASPLLSQVSCETDLRKAEASYETGLFEDIPEQLSPCLKRRVPRAEKIQAYALLARTYLELDEPEKAREAVLSLLQFSPRFEPDASRDPLQFGDLIRTVRREQAAQQVASVSKTPESLREAPATVVVVTAEEIERRGYLDLEALLHDLPGFDFSRGNGMVYSSIYQRGFRANNNDRILFLIDGVEQNDLSGNVLHLSRQYALTDIDRVEVVYGPASVMYGANAYSGVINVLTKDPEAFLAKERTLGALASVAAGTFATRSLDLSLAGKSRDGDVGWSLTARTFQSDEADLSGFDEWDYDYSSVDYKARLRLENDAAQKFCTVTTDCTAGESPYYQVTRDAAGKVIAVELTDEGERFVRDLDRRFVEATDVAFSDRTEDWSVRGKLRLSGLTIGLQVWSQREGTTPWSTDLFTPGEANGNVWNPRQTALSLRYTHPVGDTLSFNIFSRYKQDDLSNGRSRVVQFRTYANGSLTLDSLLNGCGRAPEPEIPCRGILSITFSDELSTQYAHEMSLTYKPSETLNAILGIDWKQSSVQSQNVRERLSEHTDAGLYLQSSYKWNDWRLIAGGRLDYSTIYNNQFRRAGFGTIFSPRLAAVYTPGAFTFKAIYSQAFKDPTDFEKFSDERDVSGTLRLSNPELAPERVSSSEVSAGWTGDNGLSVEAAAYQASYRDIVALGQDRFGTGQFQNLGRFRIRGLQARAAFALGPASLFANYTYTDPVDLREVSQLAEPPGSAGRGTKGRRIADIASHRANLGVDFPLRLPLHKTLDVDLRVNYVGPRKTGPGTTVATNPFREIDGASTVHLTLGSRDLVPGTTLQLIVNNLFDADYFDPGVQEADGAVFAARIPQPGRTIFLRLLYRLGAPAAPDNPNSSRQ